MKFVHLKRTALLLAATLTLGNAAFAGPDDDAPYTTTGGVTKRNSVDPGQNGTILADFPTNAEPNSGLRIFPPTDTQLIQGQRFDLRVETQIPATTSVVLKSITVNGTDITANFNTKCATQSALPGGNLESGTPNTPGLFGCSARNLSFTDAGLYTVVATATVDGVDRTITNVYPVAQYAFKGKTKHVVFFLMDGTGIPVRTAASIVGKGVFEGRHKAELNIDQMDEVSLVHTPSYDSIITDSAPGMATYVTGMKMPNNALNVSPDNTPESSLDNPRIETLWEFMKRTKSWKTGVVTDAFVTDATPAAVAAHTRSRSNRTAIAQQMLGAAAFKDGTAQPLTGYTSLAALVQPLDVIMGGGGVDWLRSDNSSLQTFYQYGSGVGRAASDQDLYVITAPSLGYSTVRNLSSLNAAPNNRPLLGIFSGEFRSTSTGLGADNIPGFLDRQVARGLATIGGKTAADPTLGMTAAPSGGLGCGATIQACFQQVPSKKEMVTKAINVLNTLAGNYGWMLLVEQSNTDKLGHTLEYERVIYDALEADDTLGFIINTATDTKSAAPTTLVLTTADHAQPETTIGVALPGSIVTGGATPSGGCFSLTGSGYPVTLGSVSNTAEPCALQDAIGTFNDGTFPTYTYNASGFPQDPDPTVKLIMDDGGRPTYTQDYLTNFQPLNPSGSSAALPNPARDPNGIFLAGNMPTKNVIPTQPNTAAALSTSSANKTNGGTTVAPHSADDVALSASGFSADLFSGVYENSDTFVRMATALSGFRDRVQLKKGTAFSSVPPVTPPATSLTGL